MPTTRRRSSPTAPIILSDAGNEFTKFEEENFKEWSVRAGRRHPTAVTPVPRVTQLR